MLVLALDTTTRQGSTALARDADLLGVELGDASLTHGQRLPGDIISLLDRHGLKVSDIDLFAVAAGPGSFTGLRIGIASMQGLALANHRPLIGISALDALYATSPEAGVPDDVAMVGAWMDAHRGQIFSALYRVPSEPGGFLRPSGAVIDQPSVGDPEAVLRRWMPLIAGGGVAFLGDGAQAYSALIAAERPDAVLPAVVPLAPAIARLARVRRDEERGTPGSIQPIYVRRPDAEIARERHVVDH
jgi:tRNA threonylcarbamoyladenosine biosynthesis protein TsaB